MSAWLFFGVFGIRLFSLAKLTESQFLVPRSGDMQFYNDWALRILGGHWVDHTAFYGLPLYAYLLATIYAVCGHNPFVPGLLQACLDAGTAVLIYRIGALIFAPAIEKTTLRVPPSGEFIGLLAAIGWACFQPAQAYSIIIMPTAWLVFVFWFVVWQIVRRRHMPPLWALLLLGGLMGFTAMGIATILFLVPMLLAALFLLWKASIVRRVTGAAMIMAGVFIGASPCLDSQLLHRAGPGFSFGAQRRQFLDRQQSSRNGLPKISSRVACWSGSDAKRLHYLRGKGRG